MKHIINIFHLAIAFALIFYTAHYVEAGDVCQTIFGCFTMWSWFSFIKKEN